ncbi:MAG: hypothetical protein PHQ27_03455 [Victivallales bacterium]|nr:hypothetical protein [Victivallales bacterium]
MKCWLSWLLILSWSGNVLWGAVEEKNVRELDSYFATPETLWQLTPGELRQKHWFAWNSNRKTQLRYAANESSIRTELWGCKIVEGLISFRDDRAVEAAMLFLSRGDSGFIDRKTFFDVLDRVRTAVVERWGKAPAEEIRRLEAGKKMHLLHWKGAQDEVRLVWSYTGRDSSRKEDSFYGEYVKLTITATDKSSPTASPAAVPADKDLRLNLKKSSDGDVVIENIPMVDQGRKGYCVVATAERVLRYYGERIDQHVLAQVSDTSCYGTQLDKMQEGMDRLEKRFHFNHRSLYLQKPPGSNILKKIYQAYNDIARKNKKTRYSYTEFCRLLMEIDNMSSKNMPLDYEVFMAVKKKVRRSDYRNFLRDVRKYVDQGIPCVWSVMLGLVPEENLPQAFGGHQRLIIGYNLRRNLIYYSDSWGRGHEKKSMTMDEAWTITLALDVYIPRTRRW